MYQKGIKRLLDVVLSACGLLVLSPLLLLLCLAIKLDSPAEYRKSSMCRGSGSC